MINTTWLNTFCTLVEVGHFTRTAERLHMTQSGVSQQLRKLEEQLGTSLIVRQGKQFTLSEAGQRFYDEARKVLLSLAHLEQSLVDDPVDEGVVRVCSPGSVGLKLYPQLLALQQAHPKLVIEYRFAPNAEIEKAIAKGEADIGLISARSSMAEVKSESIATEALLLVTPAKLGKPTWQQLMDLGFIDHPDGAHHAGLLLGENYAEFQHASDFPRKGFSNQIGLIMQPVSLGLGFTVLPAYAVEAFGNSDKVSAHSLAKPVNEELFLCLKRYRALPKRIQMVTAKIKQWL
ncbi:LysR family transcriptional regulator [Agarivorans sp.]|uniref:LysR family transcriptional regulator n=1 Tax=Agarivorans sp. TaxID=1872412 RepID=UPI003CFDC879